MPGASPDAAVDARALIGKVIGDRYEVVELLGSGGMGSVYKVRHRHIGRDFALKTLNSDLTDDSSAVARFRREAEVIAGLRHPNIVDIVDWDWIAPDEPCMIMEYMRGEDLDRRIKRKGPLGWNLIAQVTDQLLSALVVTHRASILHRDLKPRNVFLCRDDAREERAKLLDFGVAKLLSDARPLTNVNHVIGTPAAMSPEQVRGKPIGPEADVWAMGVLLHHMVTGTPPFGVGSAKDVMNRILNATPARLDERRADVPSALVELVASVLDRDRTKRVVDAQVFRGRLRDALSPLVPDAFPAPLRVNTIHSLGSVVATLSSSPDPAASATPEVVTSPGKASAKHADDDADSTIPTGQTPPMTPPGQRPTEPPLEPVARATEPPLRASERPTVRPDASARVAAPTRPPTSEITAQSRTRRWLTLGVATGVLVAIAIGVAAGGFSGPPSAPPSPRPGAEPVEVTPAVTPPIAAEREPPAPAPLPAPLARPAAPPPSSLAPPRPSKAKSAPPRNRPHTAKHADEPVTPSAPTKRSGDEYLDP